MLMRKSAHDAIVAHKDAELARLSRMVTDRNAEIAALKAETPDERRQRLRITSGVTQQERDDIIRAVFRTTAMRREDKCIDYARRVAQAALDFAFSIKGANR